MTWEVLSRINHSCAPNVDIDVTDVHLDQARGRLVALRDTTSSVLRPGY